MGKSALLLVLVSMFGLTKMYSSQSVAFLEQEDEQAFYAEQVLAREKALSGFNIVVSNTTSDFKNYRADSDTKTHRDGDFTLSAIEGDGNTVQVTATGRVGRAEYTIVGDMVSGGSAKLATLNIDGPVLKAQGRGASYLINGIDTQMDDEVGFSSGSGPNAHAVYSVLGQAHDKMVEGLREDLVIGGPDGVGGSFVSGASEEQMMAAFDGEAPDFSDIANKIESICANEGACTMLEGNQTFAGNDVFGADAPAIVYVEGNVTFRGTVDGRGILYVKGDFKTEVGEPRWEGMVFANTNGGFHELRGQPRVDGTVVLRSTTEEPMSFTVRGELSFNFSSQAVQMVAGQLGMQLDKFVSGSGGVELKNIRQTSNSASSSETEGSF